MARTQTDEILRYARDCGASSRNALERMLPRVYDELRSLAVQYLRGERNDHTLDPTALVHEAYLKLLNQHSLGCADRAQFFAAAATVMRRILVDHARAKRAAKRGGGEVITPLDEAAVGFEERAIDLLGLDEALTRLAEMDPRKSRVVELRFFGGLTVEETSDVLDVPRRTIEREWTLAKAWLKGELKRGQSQ